MQRILGFEYGMQVPKIHSVVRLFGIITENLELGFEIDEED